MRKIFILLLLLPLCSVAQYSKQKARLDRVRLVTQTADTLDFSNEQYWPIQFEKSMKRKKDQKTVWGVFLVICVIAIKV